MIFTVFRLQYAEIVYFAVVVEVEVRDRVFPIVYHLFELFEVSCLTEYDPYRFEVEIVADIVGSSLYGNGLLRKHR